MRVVIVEDELASSRRLERMLQDFKYEIIARLTSVKSAVKWFTENHNADLLFLDIHLSDGLCFEIFKSVEIDNPIIFTTAYSEYSIRAFDYNSVSYLLKPINKSQIKRAIEKATKFCEGEKALGDLKRLLEHNNLSTYKSEFAVKTGNKIKLLQSENIECFHSQDNYTYLRHNHFDYIINDSLRNVEDKLNPKQFFQASRKYIINKSFIKSVGTHSNSRFKVVLTSYERDIVVSRERSRLFKDWLEK